MQWQKADFVEAVRHSQSRNIISHTNTTITFADGTAIKYEEFFEILKPNCSRCNDTNYVRVCYGHGDMDTVLCPDCNRNDTLRMMGVPSNEH